MYYDVCVCIYTYIHTHTLQKFKNHKILFCLINEFLHLTCEEFTLLSKKQKQYSENNHPLSLCKHSAILSPFTTPLVINSTT